MKLALIDVVRGFECEDPGSPQEQGAQGRPQCAVVRPGVRLTALCVLEGEMVEFLQVSMGKVV